MTNEEKVLAVWPDAREVQLRRGKWLIAHGNDPERPGYSILGPEFASTEAAWQNAAESLPAQPEQELCPYCRETKDKCLSNEYCYSTHWEVAPVEAKEKPSVEPPFVEGEDKPIGDGFHWCRYCSRVTNHDPKSGTCLNCGTTDQYVAEPKPTPSALTTEIPERVQIALRRIMNRVEVISKAGEFDVRDSQFVENELLDVWDHHSFKPQPDSSSIPCVGCEGRPVAPNDPCAVCGSSSISTEPSEGELFYDAYGYIFLQTPNGPTMFAEIRGEGAGLPTDDNAERLCKLWNAAKGQSNGR